MPDTSFQVLKAFSVTGRDGPAVVARFLSGDPGQELYGRVACSESQQDFWRVGSSLSIFGSPELAHRVQQGEHHFILVPMASTREIVAGEIFTVADED